MEELDMNQILKSDGNTNDLHWYRTDALAAIAHAGVDITTCDSIDVDKLVVVLNIFCENWDRWIYKPYESANDGQLSWIVQEVESKTGLFMGPKTLVQLMDILCQSRIIITRTTRIDATKLDLKLPRFIYYMPSKLTDWARWFDKIKPTRDWKPARAFYKSMIDHVKFEYNIVLPNGTEMILDNVICELDMLDKVIFDDFTGFASNPLRVGVVKLYIICQEWKKIASEDSDDDSEIPVTVIDNPAPEERRRFFDQMITAAEIRKEKIMNKGKNNKLPATGLSQDMMDMIFGIKSPVENTETEKNEEVSEKETQEGNNQQMPVENNTGVKDAVQENLDQLREKQHELKENYKQKKSEDAENVAKFKSNGDSILSAMCDAKTHHTLPDKLCQIVVAVRSITSVLDGYNKELSDVEVIKRAQRDINIALNNIKPTKLEAEFIKSLYSDADDIVKKVIYSVLNPIIESEEVPTAPDDLKLFAYKIINDELEGIPSYVGYCLLDSWNTNQSKDEIIRICEEIAADLRRQLKNRAKEREIGDDTISPTLIYHLVDAMDDITNVMFNLRNSDGEANYLC